MKSAIGVTPKQEGHLCFLRTDTDLTLSYTAVSCAVQARTAQVCGAARAGVAGGGTGVAGRHHHQLRAEVSRLVGGWIGSQGRHVAGGGAGMAGGHQLQRWAEATWFCEVICV